ncbi:MAG: beta-lactamase class A [Shewanella sp.]|jgi:beta-lactamase class A
MNKILFCSCLLFTSSFVSASNLDEVMTLIEQRISGRIGVSIFDTQSKQSWDRNGNERFPMMSTFKTLACAKMLQDLDSGHLDMNTETEVKADKLLAWSPVTQKLVGSTITVQKACEATMLTSDNTAANIVLQHVGGPQGVTDFLRSVGDNVTRLDRTEPELNQANPGDLRDTTTPNAMVKTLNNLLLGGVMTEVSKTQLKFWMQQNKVSDTLLRSVLPKGWFIADRSGAGGYGSRGITAIIWNTKRAPLIISIYLTETELSMAERDSVIAEIGEEILNKYAVK